jgi:hypothetical protein
MDGFFTSNAGARIARNLVALACWSQHLCGYGQTQDTALPPVQEPVYHSVFAGYQVMSELKLTPWPAANDTVREVGGWRAYAKEAAAANAAAAAATSAPQPSTSPAGAPKP